MDFTRLDYHRHFDVREKLEGINIVEEIQGNQ
jgi:hypothetical protein